MIMIWQMYENVSREVSLMQSILKLGNHVDNGRLESQTTWLEVCIVKCIVTLQ